MKRKLFVAALAVPSLVVAGSVVAGNLTFSGRNWTTDDQTTPVGGQYDPPQSNSYSTPDANTGLGTGRFGIDTAMWTAITLNVGDQVSYDFHITDESRNFRGYGASTWFSDTGSGFYGPGGQVTNRNLRLSNSRWEDYWTSPSFSHEGYVYYPRTATQKTHLEWTFDTATSVQVSLTLEGESAPYATWTDTFSSIADITHFRVGLWDSEQDVTLSNFTHTSIPEPATAMLTTFGLIAGLMLVGCRRRMA